MRYLILSDIHANLEALEAVLEDATGLYQQIVCLGDVVGYGPNPNETTLWVRENCAAVIRGNHDRACAGLDDLRFFNPVARAAAEWTYAELGRENRDYLARLAAGPEAFDGFGMVHGAPSNEDAYLIAPGEAGPELEGMASPLTFFGHTHLQGGFRPAGGAASEIDPYELLEPGADDRLLVNPGSVGQPRDGDWRAAYAIYDGGTRQIEFRRCKYAVEPTQKKIVEAGLPSMLAERLALGR